MADRPILFSGPMVRAIWADLKTRTRRVLHEQPPPWVNFCEQPTMLNIFHQWVPSGLWRWAELDATRQRALRQWPLEADGQHYWLRPRFSVLDRLWVREAHFLTDNGECEEAVYAANEAAVAEHLAHMAQIKRAHPSIDWSRHERLRPSLHMPRWASRLTLPVVDVRVERLQDISEADAIAEGIERDPETGAYWGAEGQGVGGATRLYADPRHAYRDLWDHLNEARGFGWDANPWVVAVSFTVERRNIDVPAGELAA